MPHSRVGEAGARWFRKQISEEKTFRVWGPGFFHNYCYRIVEIRTRLFPGGLWHVLLGRRMFLRDW